MPDGPVREALVARHQESGHVLPMSRTVAMCWAERSASVQWVATCTERTPSAQACLRSSIVLQLAVALINCELADTVLTNPRKTTVHSSGRAVAQEPRTP
jgi:hypothetical protein